MAIHNTEVNGECFHFDYGFWNNPLHFDHFELYQIGEVCSESGNEMKKHVQECNEISYIVSGSGYTYIDGEQIRLKAGDILICSTGHEHMMAVDSFTTMRFLYMGFQFTDKVVSEWVDMVPYFNDRPYTLVRDDHTVMYPFVHALDEFFADNACSNSMIENYCEQIMILTYRLSQKGERVEQPVLLPRVNTSAGAIVYTTIRYIEKHIYELDSISNLANMLGYSPSYISHIFKERTGMTLQRYIVMKKHEKALELLRLGNMSVTEVAQKLNYKTIQAFSKSFTRTMGFFPSQHNKVTHEEKDVV